MNALRGLGKLLREQGYSFITPTPETHKRVNARAHAQEAHDLRDVFGWSRPFDADTLPQTMFALLCAADELERVAGEAGDSRPRYRSAVRYSELDGRLFVHSAYPTSAADSVFFGPDTYRFVRLLAAWAEDAERALDLGCGSGAGGLCLRTTQPVCLTDINERALKFAQVNAALNDVPAVVAHSDLFANVHGHFDLIIANPPYMVDSAARTYRNGGGEHGEGLAVRIVREAIPRLSPGGTLIVYTGDAVVAGKHTFLQAISSTLRDSGVTFAYEEIDPDVFGEELDQAAYADVERIAAVGLRVRSNRSQG